MELETRLFGVVPVPKAHAAGVNGGGAKLVLRAEKLVLMDGAAEASGMIAADATVETVDYQGQTVRYFVRVGDAQLQAINMIDGAPFAVGDAVKVGFRPKDCAALPG